MGPNPNEIFPNPKIPSLCFIKNVIKNPNIIVGEYTYYDDINRAENFESHVTHHYDFIGDKLIIGKFCAIAKGIEFIMEQIIELTQLPHILLILWKTVGKKALLLYLI